MPRPDLPPIAPGARLLKRGEGMAHPDVWAVPGADGVPQVWKSWGRRPALERATLGRILAAREARALALLAGIDGVPRLLGRPHPWTVAMTLLDAEPLSSKPDPLITREFFDHLWRMIEAMHQRGLTHGDVRLHNILRSRGTPVRPLLIDFTQSLVPLASVRGILRRTDRLKYLQLKARLLPHALSEGEQAELARRPWWFRLGHLWRDRLYRPFKHWRRGEGIRRRKRRDRA
jgi:hypothetical protein